MTELRHGVVDFDPANVVWVFDHNDLEALHQAIGDAHEVIFDLETTGLDEWAYRNGPWNGGYPARVALVSFTLPTDEDEAEPPSWILPLSHPESPWVSRWRDILREVMQTIKDADKPYSNVNGKFDLRYVYRLTGVDLTEQYAWDPQVAGHLLDENNSRALKEMAPRVFGVERWDDFDLTKPGAAERVPLIDLGLYAARDTYWGWQLERWEKRIMRLAQSTKDDPPEDREEVELARLGRLAVWVSMPTGATLTRMEQRGIALDRDWVNEAIVENTAAYQEAERSILEKYPQLDPEQVSFASASKWFQQLTEIAVSRDELHVAGLTARGNVTWTAGVLRKQARQGSETAQLILDARKNSKRVEFLQSWLGFQRPDTRIYPNYNIGTVATGRLSSSSPNAQQIAKELRPAFIPARGKVLVDIDLSQIELRVAAVVAPCEPMKEAYRKGWDLHKLTASSVVERPVDEITHDERQRAKPVAFGYLYGQSPAGFLNYAESSYGVVFTLEEAQRAHRAFFDRWEGLEAWHARTITQARKTGQVVSLIGRVRRLPDIHSYNQKLVAHAQNAAINAVVQSLASDIMMIAASSIEGLLPGVPAVPDVQLIGTVHDSVIAEMPEDNWEPLVQQCFRRITHLVPQVLKKLGCDFDVPLAAEASVGTRWGLGDIAVLES